MYKHAIYTIKSNEKIAPDVFRMTLTGDTQYIIRPGQFINIKLDSFYLRRPISVCDYGKDGLTVIYKTVGSGTQQLGKMSAGQTLDCLTGLGNGFDTSKCLKDALVIGGGVGIPPLYKLSKELIAQGKNVSVVLGFNTAQEIFYKKEFEDLGARVYLCTVDGSAGIKGFVTDALKEENIDYDYFFSCGPEPMLKAVCNSTKTSGQLSFESRMGCGFGACLACSCKTKYGNKRICKDGPVLEKEEIIW